MSGTCRRRPDTKASSATTDAIREATVAQKSKRRAAKTRVISRSAPVFTNALKQEDVKMIEEGCRSLLTQGCDADRTCQLCDQSFATEVGLHRLVENEHDLATLKNADYIHYTGHSSSAMEEDRGVFDDVTLDDVTPIIVPQKSEADAVLSDITDIRTVGIPPLALKQEGGNDAVTTETSSSSSALNVVTCRRCDEVFTRQKCEGCQKSFDSAKTWRTHQKLHAVHYDDVMAANLSTYTSHEEANIAEGVCPHCEKFNFVSNKAFLAHLVEKHGQLIFCCSDAVRCTKTYRVGRDEADRHMRTVHGAEQAVICPVCYKMFCTEFTMQKHNFVHNHGVCPVCTKLFRCKKNYIYHLRTHTDYTPLNRCPYCNYQPPRSKSLNKRSSYLMTHIRNAHADVAPDCSTSKVRELLLAQRNGSVVAQPLTSGTCHRRTDTNTTSPANADAICEDEVAQ